MTRPTQTSFELLGDTLRVCGELGHDEEKPFESTLRKLMETEHASLVIDLAGVGRMSGSYVRRVALAMAWAKQKNRRLSVRASRQVFRALRLGSVHTLGKVDLADGNGSPSGLGPAGASSRDIPTRHARGGNGTASPDAVPGEPHHFESEERARRERRRKAKREKRRGREQEDG